MPDIKFQKYIRFFPKSIFAIKWKPNFRIFHELGKDLQKKYDKALH